MRVVRTLAALGLIASILGIGSGAAPAMAWSGRILVGGYRGIDLVDAHSGVSRLAVSDGSVPAFLPSGRAYAYIRERADGGYSVFEKSVAADPAAPGRRIFAWGRFFLRGLDVSSRGRLVFSAVRGSNLPPGGRSLEIYLSRLDGAGVRRLTHNRAFDNDPAFSPNGRLVAFARKVHGRGQIFVKPLDGGRARRLTYDGRRDRLPAWSPDGRRLIFISEPGKRFGAREIYSVRLRGGPERRLTHNRLDETDPKYSPSGRAIAFLANDSLWIVSASGRRQKRIRGGEADAYEYGLDWAR